MLPALCLAFIALIVLMFMFLYPSIERVQGEGPWEPLALVGIASMATGAGYATFKLGRKRTGNDVSQLLSPERFQTEMLISLALIEACALVGIFVVRDDVMSLAMPVAAVVVITLGVLPHAINYVRASDQ